MQGTGSAGATVRLYVEQYEPEKSKHMADAQQALKPLIGEPHKSAWPALQDRRIKLIGGAVLVCTAWIRSHSPENFDCWDASYWMLVLPNVEATVRLIAFFFSHMTRCCPQFVQATRVHW